MNGFLNKRGATLLEAVTVSFIIAAVLAGLMANGITRINKAKYDRTVHELTSIAQAAANYLLQYGTGSCPSLSQLVPEFLPSGFMNNAGTAFSPFGTSYNQPACYNNLVTASVSIPAGIGQNDPQGQLMVKANQGGQQLLEISRTIPNEYTGYLSYCLKYGCV